MVIRKAFVRRNGLSEREGGSAKELVGGGRPMRREEGQESANVEKLRRRKYGTVQAVLRRRVQTREVKEASSRKSSNNKAGRTILEGMAE